MLGRVISIALIFFLLAGGILGLTSCEEEIPAEVPEQKEAQEPQSKEPEKLEPRAPEVMTIGDFISKVVIEEYQSSMEGKETTLKQGTAVRVLGRVEDFWVAGEYPHFRGQVDLKPYYCSSRLQCIFEGAAVEELRNLQKDQDVTVEGKYGGIKHYTASSRDIYYLLGCSSLSIESPQSWTIPMAEEMTANAMIAEYLSNWSVQSKFGKGELIRIFGSVYSVSISWDYLKGIWGDLLVSKRGVYGVECKFEGEKVYEIMQLPEGQEVVIEGEYDHGSANCAYLSNCSLIYP